MPTPPQLLEVARQQPQPLVIGEGRARFGVADLRVIEIGERGERGRIFVQSGQAEVAVHFCRTFEQFLECPPAEADRRRKADRRPQRIASADAFAERQDAGFVDAPFHRLVGRRGQRDHLAVRVLDIVLLHPLQGGFGVEHRFLGGEGLGRHHQQRRRRIEVLDRILQRDAVDVGHDRDVVARILAAQRIDQQVRPQRRSADADVQHMADIAQRTALDRVDQRAHPFVKPARARDAVGIALIAFGGVLDRAILGDVDMLAAEHRVAPAREVLRLRQRGERLDRLDRQMRLRPVEMDAGDVQAEPRQAVRILIEQFDQLGGGQGFDRGPVAHKYVRPLGRVIVTVPYRSIRDGPSPQRRRRERLLRTLGER